MPNDASSNDNTGNTNAALARILEQSIAYIVQDEFHPVLYEAMSGLHQYVGKHFSRLFQQHEQQQQEQHQEKGSGAVSNNLQAAVTVSENFKEGYHNATANGKAMSREHGEFTTSTLAMNGASSPALLVKEPMKSSKDAVEREKQSKLPVDTILKNGMNEQLERERDTHKLPEPKTTFVTAAKEQLRTAKANHNTPANLKTTSKAISRTGIERSVNDQRQHAEIPNPVQESPPPLPPPLPAAKLAQNEPQPTKPPQSKPQPTKPPKSKPTQPTQSKPQNQNLSTQPTQSKPQNQNLSAEVRFEQEKRRAAEQHRRNVELQRKLSRAEWKTKDLEEKLKFLATEERKLKLAVNSQQAGTVSAANATESLRQTLNQIASIKKQLQEQEVAVADIKAELLNQETTPLDNSQSAREIEEEQKRRFQAQRKLEMDLEARKKAAAEQRRKELEEERHRARIEQKKQDEEKRRQFLEQEQRKLDLMNTAKVANNKHMKPGPDNSLLEKLSSQVSALDAEIHRVDNDTALTEDEGPMHHGESVSVSDEVHQTMDCHAGAEYNDRPAQAEFINFDTYEQPSFQSNDYETTDPYRPQPSASGSDKKYTQMANQPQETEPDESTMAELKRHILLSWALQPPYMQTLRPIGELLSTVQQAFPPAFDLPRHDYFDDWPAITEVTTEQQLSKSVRRIRFFLHPDKRPRDLTDQHQFLCKLLWDVINDAWEDYQRVKDELGWIHSG